MSLPQKTNPIFHGARTENKLSCYAEQRHRLVEETREKEHINIDKARERRKGWVPHNLRSERDPRPSRTNSRTPPFWPFELPGCLSLPRKVRCSGGVLVRCPKEDYFPLRTHDGFSFGQWIEGAVDICEGSGSLGVRHAAKEELEADDRRSAQSWVADPLGRQSSHARLLPQTGILAGDRNRHRGAEMMDVRSEVGNREKGEEVRDFGKTRSWHAGKVVEKDRD